MPLYPRDQNFLLPPKGGTLLPLLTKSTVSVTHSLTLSISAFASPILSPFALLLSPNEFEAGSWPGLIKLDPSPVAYSLPMEGKTLSPADSATNKVNGTSQTHSPKNEAISLNDGGVD
jgi:hypothetical protein